MKTIKLAGIDWCTENLKDEQGNQHFTHEEALRLAEEQGFRLPTKKEIDALRSLPSCWDCELKGRWFAENEADLKNPDKSIFLPAAGWRYYDNGALHNRGDAGYYRSSTQYSGYGQFMRFDSGTTDTTNTYRSFGFSVRCVED